MRNTSGDLYLAPPQISVGFDFPRHLGQLAGLMMTLFTQKVIRLIQNIPSGKVSTYGQIAKLAGKPQGARGVSWILHSCTRSHRLPWFRVIGAQGKISIPWGSRGFQRQRRLLLEEDVNVSAEGKIDLADFGWKRKKE